MHLFILSLVFLLVACGDPVADELEKYVNEDLEPLVEREEEVINEYDSVTGAGYTDDYTTFVHLDTVVIPLYLDFIADLESIKLENKEVRDVHEIFIAATNKQYDAMVKMLAALDQQDYELVGEANEMLTEGRAGLRDYQAELESLLDEHGMYLE